MTKFQSVLVRFAKGFVSAGIASMIAVLSTGVTVHSLIELKTLGFTLLTAFVSGGILAVEKYVNWQ